MRTLEQTTSLLAMIATIDNRVITAEMIAMWHKVLGDFPYDELEAAAVWHLQHSTEYTVPALILNRVRAVREESGYRRDPAKLYAVDVIEHGELR